MHIMLVGTDIKAVGAAVTLTVMGDDVALHPLLPITVTENVPEELAVILCVVAPLFHI